MVRYHIKVTGRVQGVCYRFFCQDAAASKSLTGWAKNQPDGSVELEVQGKEPDIDSFCCKLQKGPPLARVADLRKTEMSTIAEEVSFVIAY